MYNQTVLLNSALWSTWILNDKYRFCKQKQKINCDFKKIEIVLWIQNSNVDADLVTRP